MPKKITQEDFIKKAIEIHNDKYDYSNVIYHDCKTKVCIICPKHGEFWQTPDKHINKKQGCPKCKGEKVRKKFVSSKQYFIGNAKKIHGDKYDYSKVEYINNQTKICIICDKHGEFLQTPYKHLIGQGCPICNHNGHIIETNLYNKLIDSFKNEKIVHCYKNKAILGTQELDIYFPKYKIGIEVQGEHHFKPIDFGGNGKETSKKIFEKIKERDYRKKEICKKNGIKLLYFTFNYDSFLGEKTYKTYIDLINEIKKLINEK